MMRTTYVLRNEFVFSISHYKSSINQVHMWLDPLIVVDDEILSSFSLDNEGYSAVIGGRCNFVVVEHCFIWQCSALN